MGLDEPLAIAGQVTQLADGGGWHEAAAEQSVLEELGEPGRVGHVGLASGQDLDVAGVDQHELEAALLEHIPDQLPVLAGGLHHDLADPLLREPVGQRLQLPGERRVGPDLLAASPGLTGRAHAGGDLVLADVEPGTALVDDVHQRHLLHPPVRCPTGPTKSTKLTRVLGATVGGAGKVPAQSNSRAHSHQGGPSFAGHAPFSSVVAAAGHGGLIRFRMGT